MKRIKILISFSSCGSFSLLLSFPVFLSSFLLLFFLSLFFFFCYPHFHLFLSPFLLPPSPCLHCSITSPLSRLFLLSPLHFLPLIIPSLSLLTPLLPLLLLLPPSPVSLARSSPFSTPLPSPFFIPSLICL